MKAGAEQLRKLCRDILGAQGVNADDASIVGDVLVEANLRGHDSHGVVRIPQWVKGLEAGAIRDLLACVPGRAESPGAATEPHPWLDAPCGTGTVKLPADRSEFMLNTAYS